MGNVFKRENSPFWFMDFTRPDGARVRRSTGMRDKREAERVLAVQESRAIKGEMGFGDNDYPLDKLARDFLAWKAIQVRPGALRRYELSLRNFQARVPAKSVESVSLKMVETYREQRLQEGASKRTVNIEVGNVSRLFKWGVDRGHLRENPIGRLKPYPERKEDTRNPRRALTTEEVRSLLAAALPHERPLWLAFVTTGMRHAELVELRWQDVELTGEPPVIRLRPESTKTGTARTIPICPELRETLQDLWKARANGVTPQSPEGHVFVTRLGTPWRNNLLTRFKRTVRRAGINPEGVCIHSLRHTFTSDLIAQNVDPKTVQELLGHKTLWVTMQVYAHARKERAVEAVARLSYATLERRETGTDFKRIVEMPRMSG